MAIDLTKPTVQTKDIQDLRFKNLGGGDWSAEVSFLIRLGKRTQSRTLSFNLNSAQKSKLSILINSAKSAIDSRVFELQLPTADTAVLSDIKNILIKQRLNTKRSELIWIAEVDFVIRLGSETYHERGKWNLLTAQKNAVATLVPAILIAAQDLVNNL